ncbi:hypothetical protein HNQ93_000962 [Hymenobacter luteus]|uniref:STAS/SEC14 domain-containing protein n=2 Tax=Hymenobacter TaxID=89966 RepID=A0A7W9WBY5_9BACT|nr:MULTISPECIES: hypothetical protein [Hymenobacter]MBB4599558.1 hypothetical protein [Hymenobacter latericoloratus]MBB6058132.1 hypothetical protein [Hymenobacter luteus]
MPYFENTAGHLEVEPAGFLRLTWHSAHTQQREGVRPLLECALQALRETGLERALIDQRARLIHREEDAVWMLLDYFPRLMAQTHYRYGAYLESAEFFTRNETRYLMAEAHTRYGVPCRYFGTEAEAVVWLLRQEVG